MKKFFTEIKGWIPYFVVCIIFVGIAALCDFWEHTQCMEGRFWEVLSAISMGRLDADSILEAFVNLWGIAIAILIFVIELSRNVKYGITLKRIASIELGKWSVSIMMMFYFIWYPVAYFAHYKGWINVLLICWLITLIELLMTLGFCIIKTRSEEIRKILKKDTIRALKETKDNLDTKQNIQNIIDGLSIMEILLQTDYTNKEERDHIAEIITDILTDEDIIKCLHGSETEYVILMNWMEKIYSKFSIEETQKEEILIRYIEYIIDTIEEKFEKNKSKGYEAERVLYHTQILIAMAKFNDPIMNKIMIEVWKRMPEYKKECMLYLILYTEHYFWFVNKKLLTWIDISDRNLEFMFKQLLRDEVNVDPKEMVMFWMSWTEYDSKKDKWGMDYFFNFMREFKCLSEKEIQYYSSVTLEYLKLRVIE